MLEDVSFSVREGEILGVAGIEGNGQRELVDILFNFRKPQSGTAEVEGVSLIRLSQRKIREQGVSMIPEDRMTYGIADKGSIEENVLSDRISKKRFNWGPLFRVKRMYAESDRLIKDFKIKCKSRKQQVMMLSGGNIQKVVVARELSCSPRLIIADQPTRGIDVGATEFIRNKLVELSRAGAAVLLVSADINEVLMLSDSLIVMNGGKVAAYFEDAGILNDVMLGEYMLGLKHHDKETIAKACHEEAMPEVSNE